MTSEKLGQVRIALCMLTLELGVPRTMHAHTRAGCAQDHTRGFRDSDLNLPKR